MTMLTQAKEGLHHNLFFLLVIEVFIVYTNKWTIFFIDDTTSGPPLAIYMPSIKTKGVNSFVKSLCHLYLRHVVIASEVSFKFPIPFFFI
jgi:hypothetical protein